MITARLLTALAASSLAAIAYAQTQPAPSNQPNAAPGYNSAHPRQREMKSAGKEAASPNSRTAPGSALNTPASSQGNHTEAMKMAAASPAAAPPWSSMPVKTPSGQSLGSVSRVVPGLNGRPSSGYVLVSGAHGMSTPVSYRTAEAMVRNGKLVLSRSRFRHAPKITRGALRNRADPAWRIKADRYWMRQGRGEARR